jgi:hypothetical protein
LKAVYSMCYSGTFSDDVLTYISAPLTLGLWLDAWTHIIQKCDNVVDAEIAKSVPSPD